MELAVAYGAHPPEDVNHDLIYYLQRFGPKELECADLRHLNPLAGGLKYDTPSSPDELESGSSGIRSVFGNLNLKYPGNRDSKNPIDRLAYWNNEWRKGYDLVIELHCGLRPNDRCQFIGRNPTELALGASTLFNIGCPRLDVPDNYMDAIVVAPDHAFAGAGGEESNVISLEFSYDFTDPHERDRAISYLLHVVRTLYHSSVEEIERLAPYASKNRFFLAGELSVKEARKLRLDEYYNMFEELPPRVVDYLKLNQAAKGRKCCSLFCMGVEYANPNDGFCEVALSLKPEEGFTPPEYSFSSVFLPTATTPQPQPQRLIIPRRLQR